MSASRFTKPALAGAALIGGGLYFSRSKKASTGPASEVEAQVQRKREQSEARRDLGISGAGVGGNAMTGGTELASGLKPGNTSENAKRDPPRPNVESRDELPQKALGGGYGGGNTNAGAIEKKGSQLASAADKVWNGKAGDVASDVLGSGKGGKNDKDDSSASSSSKLNPSEKLQQTFGTGGKAAGTAQGENDPKDTRVKSNHADTPTNRGGSPFDKHRKDVTATQSTGGSEDGGKKNSDKGDDSSDLSISQKLQQTFGTGGKTAGTAPWENDPKDTRVKSHHADTPTNRGGSPFDKHRKDVTAVSATGESGN